MTTGYDHLRPVILEQVRTHFRRYLSPWMAERIELGIAHPHDGPATGDMIAMDIYAKIMTEKLPPQHVRHRVRYAHPEAVGAKGYAVDARFATWYDHFTATYRGRWWARLLRLHKRRLRYTFVPVPYITTQPVHCNHLVEVSILDSWRYPKAATSIRDMGLREPVLYSPARADAYPAMLTGDQPWH